MLLTCGATLEDVICYAWDAYGRSYFFLLNEFSSWMCDELIFRCEKRNQINKILCTRIEACTYLAPCPTIMTI
jgi:hypothetical protein